jgi:hypothetical protein
VALVDGEHTKRHVGHEKKGGFRFGAKKVVARVDDFKNGATNPKP